ncbi:Beta-barrel assembly machine subunit BamC [Bisgaardia hudsonensis]|uniref:Beta-barrel assembly machine subunit BamC n=1 Tax=Bisgaardia hudsonensis TaxID=109472 RepID=A0A4R2N330_9PAST|nr:outer membrane protein assembly factor BamC [Bisgaardia hudsonensis]QLB12730.1 outer membrane assembly protein BamC [Bisgaardia hudsonensis]TCP14281.1 Beta-barrel assembly machine subunit BamC [Bisgaardia hudsonensis]
MKKSLLTIAIATLLVACSADNESKLLSNDSFQNKVSQLPTFQPIATGGINLLPKDPNYQLPKTKVKSVEAMDIRPPIMPLSVIKNSVAQFDGERAFIAYPIKQKDVYSILQIERLLKDHNVAYEVRGQKILTDWTSTRRLDEIGDTQARYQIEQVINGSSSTLMLLVLEMKRDDVIFTPKVADKRRYASDQLNLLVGELNQAYQKQKTMLLNANMLMPVNSELITDLNGKVALMLGASFEKSWVKLGDVLPKLGFEIKEQTVERGNRELKYRALTNEDWFRISIEKSDLENGKYFMQLSTVDKRSSVVITDEDGKALSGKQAQVIYQALHNLLAR